MKSWNSLYNNRVSQLFLEDIKADTAVWTDSDTGEVTSSYSEELSGQASAFRLYHISGTVASTIIAVAK